MREELRAVLAAHAAAGTSDGVDRAAVTDVALPTAEIIGWATLVAADVPLTAEKRARISSTAVEAFALIALQPVQARPYFARLGLIATLAASLTDGGPAEETEP